MNRDSETGGTAPSAPTKPRRGERGENVYILRPQIGSLFGKAEKKIEYLLRISKGRYNTGNYLRIFFIISLCHGNQM